MPAVRPARTFRETLDPHEDEILERVAAGEFMHTLAEDYGVSISAIKRWRNATPERAQRFSAAREASAEVEVARAAQILEEAAKDPELTAAQAAIARSRAEHHWKLAARRSPEFWEKAPVEVNLNLQAGQLHLEALRAHGSMDLQRLPPPVLEAEIVEGEWETGQD